MRLEAFCWNILQSNVSSRPRGPAGPGPSPYPQDFFKIMQFSGNFKGKTPILSKFWAQGPPPLGSKLRWAALTKILDAPLNVTFSFYSLTSHPESLFLFEKACQWQSTKWQVMWSRVLTILPFLATQVSSVLDLLPKLGASDWFTRPGCSARFDHVRTKDSQ